MTRCDHCGGQVLVVETVQDSRARGNDGKEERRCVQCGRSPERPRPDMAPAGYLWPYRPGRTA